MSVSPLPSLVMCADCQDLTDISGGLLTFPSAIWQLFPTNTEKCLCTRLSTSFCATRVCTLSSSIICNYLQINRLLHFILLPSLQLSLSLILTLLAKFCKEHSLIISNVLVVYTWPRHYIIIFLLLKYSVSRKVIIRTLIWGKPWIPQSG